MLRIGAYINIWKFLIGYWLYIWNLIDLLAGVCLTVLQASIISAVVYAKKSR